MGDKKIVVQECDPAYEEPQIPPSQNMLDGCIWLNAITESAARDAAAALLRTTYMDPSRPIMVYIDSTGGEVDAMTSIISVMDSIPNKIVTVCVGKAMSAGAFILAHGDIRFVSPRSRIMIHEISGGAVGNIADVANDAAEMGRLNATYMELLAADCKTKGGVAALKKLFSAHRDHYMDAQQAIDFGIADAIGVPRLVKNNQWILDVSQFPESKKKKIDKKKAKK